MTITGTNLSGATAVDFGANAGTITADSAGSVTATSPAGTGTVDVTVTNPYADVCDLLGRRVHLCVRGTRRSPACLRPPDRPGVAPA